MGRRGAGAQVCRALAWGDGNAGRAGGLRKRGRQRGRGNFLRDRVNGAVSGGKFGFALKSFLNTGIVFLPLSFSETGTELKSTLH